MMMRMFDSNSRIPRNGVPKMFLFVKCGNSEWGGGVQSKRKINKREVIIMPEKTQFLQPSLILVKHREESFFSILLAI